MINPQYVRSSLRKLWREKTKQSPSDLRSDRETNVFLQKLMIFCEWEEGRVVFPNTSDLALDEL